MATNPYTSVTISGYNSNPPSDDGAQTASNQVKWSTIKTKLADPIKTLAEGVNSAAQTAFGNVVVLTNDESSAMGGSLALTQSEKTIASGVITPTRSNHSIDTQSDAASDDLDTMNVGSTADGAILFVTAENASRVVTLKNANGASGQMLLAAERAVAMDNANFHYLMIRDGTSWYEVKNSAVQETMVQTVYASLSTVATGVNTTIAVDDTIPQNTEGTEFITVTITPRYTTSRLRITTQVNSANSATSNVAALFQDITANALAGWTIDARASGVMNTAVLIHEMASGTTSATTFKLRVGGASGANTVTVNGAAGARLFGGVSVTTMTVDEIYDFL